MDKDLYLEKRGLTYRSAGVGGSALVLGSSVHVDVVWVVVWVGVGVDLGLVGLSWIESS